MRVLLIAGILLVLLGAVVLSGRPRFKSEAAVLEVGEFKATVEEHRALPPWVGVLGIVGGVLLIVTSTRRRIPGA